MIEVDWLAMRDRIVWTESSIEIICDCGRHLVISEGPNTCDECGVTWELRSQLMRADAKDARYHFGDPCIYCGVAHDAVSIGSCLDTAVRTLLDELHAKSALGDPNCDLRRAAQITQQLVIQHGLTGKVILAVMRRLDDAGA